MANTRSAGNTDGSHTSRAPSGSHSESIPKHVAASFSVVVGARDMCALKSSTCTRLSPDGCRTEHTTRVLWTYLPFRRCQHAHTRGIRLLLTGATGIPSRARGAVFPVGPTPPNARPRGLLPLDKHRRTEPASDCVPRDTPAAIVPGAPWGRGAT